MEQQLNREETKRMQNLNEAKEAFLSTARRTRDRVASTAKTLDASVHANTWAYLGGVAAVSAVLGFVMGRKMAGTQRGNANGALH